jgi:hypothetical protein
MSLISNELFELSARIKAESSYINGAEFEAILAAVGDAVSEVGKAWSGSWLGYQSRVY